jgi:hypothetical protein
MYVRKQFARYTRQRSPQLNFPTFICGETRKTQVYSAPIENEDTLHLRVFISVALFATVPGP